MFISVLKRKTGELDGVRVLKPETVDAMTTNQLAPELLPLVYNPNIIIRDMTFGWYVTLNTDIKAGTSLLLTFLYVTSVFFGASRGIGVGIPHNEPENVPRPGEFTWGGGMSTNFWVSPSDRTVIVVMVSRMMKHAES